jgi:hypothetical protein
MEPRITKLSPNEFRFEYEDIGEAPTLHDGDTFLYEGESYRIRFHKKVFTEQVYTSVMVVAESV